MTILQTTVFNKYYILQARDYTTFDYHRGGVRILKQHYFLPRDILQPCRLHSTDSRHVYKLLQTLLDLAVLDTLKTPLDHVAIDNSHLLITIQTALSCRTTTQPRTALQMNIRKFLMYIPWISIPSLNIKTRTYRSLRCNNVTLSWFHLTLQF